MNTKTLTIDEAAERMNIIPAQRGTRGRLYKRLAALGYGKECGRCGGDKQWCGGVCWGCDGAGTVIPPKALTESVITEARRRQDAGELAEYFAQEHAQKLMRLTPWIGGDITAMCKAIGELAATR